MIASQPICFQLKALFSPCTVFCLSHYDMVLLEKQLKEKILLMPHFFQNTPVILDLEKVANIEIDLPALKALLMRYQLIMVGIRNPSEKQKQQALQAGLPLLQSGKPVANATPATPVAPQVVPQESKVINQPVRSGMQVYAKQTDLIVTSSVSAGAEIMADGHIHVYSYLRGRALAGMQGNRQARIFCRHLDAELVAIAGYYLTKEEMPVLPASVGMLQIYLDQERIKIEEI